MPRAIRVNDSRRWGGFTLIELLIAITLLGLISTVTYGAIWTANRSLQAVERLAEQNGSLRLMQEFMRRSLSQARGVLAVSEGRMQVLFSGRRESLTYIAPAPLQRGRAGGLFSYHLERNREGDLRITYAQFFVGREPDAEPLATGESRLLDGVEELAFSYYGRDEPGAKPKWMDEWPRQDSLPQLVRISLKLAEGGKTSTITLAIKGQVG